MTIILIDIYRCLFSNILSVLLGVHCRFTPTCSCYARDAMRLYGFRRGFIKTVGRLLRCHPFGSHRHLYDPVEENVIEEALTRGT